MAETKSFRQEEEVKEEAASSSSSVPVVSVETDPPVPRPNSRTLLGLRFRLLIVFPRALPKKKKKKKKKNHPVVVRVGVVASASALRGDDKNDDFSTPRRR